MPESGSVLVVWFFSRLNVLESVWSADEQIFFKAAFHKCWVRYRFVCTLSTFEITLKTNLEKMEQSFSEKKMGRIYFPPAAQAK
jgi:hypothetical protein